MLIRYPGKFKYVSLWRMSAYEAELNEFLTSSDRTNVHHFLTVPTLPLLKKYKIVGATLVAMLKNLIFLHVGSVIMSKGEIQSSALISGFDAILATILDM